MPGFPRLSSDSLAVRLFPAFLTPFFSIRPFILQPFGANSRTKSDHFMDNFYFPDLEKNSLLRQKSGPGLRRAPIILIQSASDHGSQHEPQRRIGINLIVSRAHFCQNIVNFHSQDTNFLIKGFQTYILKVSNCTIFRSPPAHHRNYSLLIIHHSEILAVYFEQLFRPFISRREPSCVLSFDSS